MSTLSKCSTYIIVCTPIHKTNAHHPCPPFLTMKVSSASYDSRSS